MILFLLVVTATFRPAQPTVGDLITIDFQRPVVLEASKQYEIVSQRGRRVVLRTFEPKPFPLSGRAGEVQFRNLVVPVRSVLKKGDDLQPAPLKPPHPIAYPRLPVVAIVIAGLLAAAAWAATYLLWRRRTSMEVEEDVDPAERFRDSVAASRRWADLADATRRYLAWSSPHLGVELTTTQLLSRLDAGRSAIVAPILRQGDLEKFSPWGAPPADFEGLATAALSLIPERQEEAA